MKEMVRYAPCVTPLGKMILAANNTQLIGAWFVDQRYFPDAARALERHDQEHATLKQAVRELDEYFHAGRQAFAVPLAPHGTCFQSRVWEEIGRTPHGQTTTYATIAGRVAGTNSHARSVGAATGRNPLSIFIPCHRVVATGGALTGYAGGLWRKELLLAGEGAR